MIKRREVSICPEFAEKILSLNEKSNPPAMPGRIV